MVCIISQHGEMPDSANGNEAEGFYGYDAEAGWAMDFYDEPLSNLVQEFSTEKTEEYEILPDDPESEQRRFQEKLEGFMQEQLPDLREPAKKTKEAQRSIWEAWKGYVSRNARKDPNQVILDLCRQLREAESICQAFLENYVERSVKPRLSLGPNEMENVRTVTSVNSVMQHWELLVGAAEREVLQRMRFKDSENTSLWRLAYKKKEDGIAEGPGMKIRRWIEGDMADKYSLLREQTFVKVEATIHDILLMLDILWTRAEDILCDPSTRLAMQQAIILDSMGGWRSGSLMEFCYQNVEVAVVRDPENHERTTLIAEITVQQNKRPSKRAQKSQDQIMSFTVTCVPCEKICLLRSLIACALQAGAFEAGFDSFETLLKQPKLENVDYVPLRWKEGMAKKPIIPIKYYTFWRIWHRILFVMGCRSPFRPYSMRVGTNCRLDGPLTPALQSYISSNTPAVRAKSYQPRHVSEDLARLAFGDLAGRKDELNQFLRQSTYKRDDQAPLYPTAGDLAGFEKRKDVSLLREKHREAIVQHGSGSSAAKRAGAKVWDRVNALSALAVNVRRRAYFERVDRLRARGISTAIAPIPSTNPHRKTSQSRYSLAAAVKIGRYLQGRASDTQPDSTVYVDSLMAYLANRNVFDEPILVSPIAGSHVRGKRSHRETERLAQCLLCGHRFARRTNLTRHCDTTHRNQFQKPFACPECTKAGKHHVIQDRQGWSSHVARCHGEDNAPNFSRGQRPPMSKESRCLICSAWISGGHNLTKHIRLVHEKTGLFEKPFFCPECFRQGMQNEVADRKNWTSHVKWHHKPTSIENKPVGERTVCLICTDEFTRSRFMDHFVSVHLRQQRIFEKPFDCPTCRHKGRTILVTSMGDWFCHVAAEHQSQDEIVINKIEHAEGDPGHAESQRETSELQRLSVKRYIDLSGEETGGRPRSRRKYSLSPPSSVSLTSSAATETGCTVSTRASTPPSDLETFVIDPRLLQIHSQCPVEQGADEDALGEWYNSG